MNKYIKYALFTLLNIGLAFNGFSQSATTTSASDFNISINTTLASIAIVLLFIIIILSITVNQAVDLYKNKPASDNIKSVIVLIGLLLLSHLSFSQITETTQVIDHSAKQLSAIYFYSFIVVIIVEIAIIVFLLKALRFLTGIERRQKIDVENSTVSFWQKINKLRPIEDEDSLDTGHSYDGIRELDNVTPPWFKAGFAASIIFALVYLYRYEIAHSAPDQFEEYETEMFTARRLQDSLLKLESNQIDENSITLLNGTDLDAGKTVFMSNCSACHGDKGQGGVGPNLTDEYWLHNGSLSDVFKSIKYGWADKGMKAWKDDFSAKQIAQLTSYIKSLKGSNPANAKEKQGDLYIEKIETAAKDTTQLETIENK